MQLNKNYQPEFFPFLLVAKIITKSFSGITYFLITYTISGLIFLKDQ